MLRKYNFPVTIEVEVWNERNLSFQVVNTYIVNTQEALINKLQYIRCIYNLENKNFNVFIIAQSLVNVKRL